ncbi:hypothetical protein HY637_04990 [Candidatus Woesearchaeota archaeon]|nr:hypothetical protein [Candidatus Woesearchaeota archaeon]
MENKRGRPSEGKQIMLEIHFFTNKIDDDEKNLNVVETCGIVKVLENHQRGIKTTKEHFFNNWKEIQDAILRSFSEAGIQISKRYQNEI